MIVLRKYSLSILIVSSFFLLLQGCLDAGSVKTQDKTLPHPITYRDACNVEVTFEKSPGRILAWNVWTRDLLQHIGVSEDKIVMDQGVGSSTAEGWQKAVASQNPDLLLYMSETPIDRSECESFQALRSSPIKVIVSDQTKLEKVAEDMRAFGLLLGVEEGGNRAAGELTNTMQNVKDAVRRLPSMRVAWINGYSEWDNPLKRGVLLTGRQTLTHDILTMANGENIVKDDFLGTKANITYTLKEFISLEPDVLLVRVDPGRTAISGPIDQYPEWGQIIAVQKGNVVEFPREFPRVKQLRQELIAVTEALYPELKNKIQ
ncbi:ABC transporter substrate-binding protein [Paenibacillus tyrfis]|uniref:ABC transporter substrate-binding protein n=1 Tax=Paenibacillus tyrfis TaxID=1501230 RepID=UPI00209FCC89|nr:ABC transporter substrate-binding protein [Paenibacillus tyrfis]MCP1311400.1 ABC transporter substrate-binding protein [Paenibacillus tyrfis]